MTDSSDPRPGGSRLTLLWLLLPLVLAGLYATTYGLWQTEPTLEGLAPPGAVLVHRFRDREALDRFWFRPAEAGGRPAELVAASRNLQGLPGVDPHRPFELVFVPAPPFHDASIVVFPLADPEAFRAAFEDLEPFFERGQIRYPGHVEIRGDWGAIGADPEAVRRIGGGGLATPDLGEDAMLAVDVPGMVRLALRPPVERRWRPLLAALGFDPEAATAHAEGSAAQLAVPAGRLLRVHDGWRVGRCWFWHDERRVRADLEPAPGRLADRLRALAARGAGSTDAVQAPEAPPEAEAWVRVQPGARAALLEALWSSGVDLPGEGEEGPLASLMAGEGGLLLSIFSDREQDDRWTLLLAGEVGDLSAFHGGIPAAPGEAQAEGEEMPLLGPAAGADDRVTITRADVDGIPYLALGRDGEHAVSRFTRQLRSPEASASSAPEAPPDGAWTLVATFGFSAEGANTLLGEALAPGGFLPVLSGGPITGALWTDGRLLRLEASAGGP